MITLKEKAFFFEQGYLHVQGAVTGDLLNRLQCEFDRVWNVESRPVNQHKLLRYPLFIDLIEHPPLLDRHRAVFGSQVQLLAYDIGCQPPRSSGSERGWHRDFVVPGEWPLAINTLLYLDPMDEERGPTRVVPRSQNGPNGPAEAISNLPLPDEVAINAQPGDAVFINASIWHTGGVNRSEGLRRVIYLYYGYWWLKRYEYEQALPWQALENAGEPRLRLLGLKMPGMGLHAYDPGA